MNLKTIGKIRNIAAALVTVVKRIAAGKCVACGECTERWIDGDVCANRDCGKCGMNNGR
jgi:hypothetical protein